MLGLRRQQQPYFEEAAKPEASRSAYLKPSILPFANVCWPYLLLLALPPAPGPPLTVARQTRVRRVAQDKREQRQRAAIWQKCGATSHLEKFAINGKIRDMAFAHGFPCVDLGARSLRRCAIHQVVAFERCSEWLWRGARGWPPTAPPPVRGVQRERLWKRVGRD